MTDPPVPPADSTQEAKKQEAKKRKKRKKQSSRGAASFFRNAYRTQLDLTQLADNKASIMISVNGFILTVTLASGGVVLASQPRLLLPVSLLLVSCLGSMIYAVLAARPRRAARQEQDPEAPGIRTGNLLFHETAGGMTEDDYAEELNRLLANDARSNEEMARHLYGLGMVLVRKFRLLRISYAIFVVGLTVSILAFLAVSAYGILPGAAGSAEIGIDENGEPTAETATFSGVYEPSGLVVLADGTVLVTEDEEDRPFTLGVLDPDGAGWSSETPLDPGALLDDLEGLAVDPAGLVYAIGSHSRTEEGRSRPERERLARFSVEDGKISDLRVVSDLAPRLGAAALGLPETEAEARLRVLRPGLDVEALVWDGGGQGLLLGLRSPLVDGRAVILPLGNLEAAFAGAGPAEVGERILLDLAGDGIRSLAADPAGGYLLVSGPSGSPDRPFGLWHWQGPSTDHAEPLRDLPPRVEGVEIVTVDGEPTVLLVLDDGSPKDDRPASYLLVPRSELGS